MPKKMLNDFLNRACFNVKLAPYTTWKIGGAAKILFKPKCIEDFISVLSHARDMKMPYYIIGNGSNILVDDEGLDGIVIITKNINRIEIVNKNYIDAEAGCHLHQISSNAKKAGLSGFEFLVGIPGTVGGAIVGNAGLGGQNGPSIIDVLEGVKIYNHSKGTLLSISANELELGYRCSNIIKNRAVIVSAIFKGNISDQDIIEEKEKRIFDNRRKKHPKEPYTVGSVFKQPANGNPAGWYIDKAGLKGVKRGGAEVSRKHANWIINNGNANSSDVKNLIMHIQNVVYKEFNIVLDREVVFLPEDITW